MQKPFAAYQGDEPYIFVSYAHEDAPVVYEQLTALKDAGFNIWYDEGISPGAVWRNELADAISGCALFLFFVTSRSAASDNCLKEVNFAQNRNRPTLPVHLEKTELPTGLELSLSDRQAILKYELSTEGYRTKLHQSIQSILGHEQLMQSIETPTAPKRSVLPVALAIGAVVLVALGFFMLGGDDAPETVPEEVAVIEEAEPVLDIPLNSIVVLPFDNLSPLEENAYFAAGIHEDVLSNLSRVDGLRVISRTSALKLDRNLPLKEISEQLQVAHFLEGSVRRAGNQVRISVQLINAIDDTNLWGETYDRELIDVFAIQSDVSEKIAEQLQLNLDVASGQQLQLASQNDAEIYADYLRGRELMNHPVRENLLEAIELFDKARKQLPGFADAHAYHSLANLEAGRTGFFPLDNANWRTARDSARAAVEANADSWLGHYAMGRILNAYSDRAKARTSFQRAHELAPQNSEVLYYYGLNQLGSGKISEALRLWSDNVALDPLSARSYLALASTGENTRQYLDKARQLAGSDATTLWEVAGRYATLGYEVDALEVTLEAAAIDPKNPTYIATLSQRLLNMEQEGTALKWIEQLKTRNQTAYWSELGNYYRFVHDHDGQFETAYQLSAALGENNVQAMANYAYTYSQKARGLDAEERTEEALETREKAISNLMSVLGYSADTRRLPEDFDPGGRAVPFTALAALLILVGEEAEGLRIADRVIALYNAEPAYLEIGGAFYRGLCHAMKGNTEAALKDFELYSEMKGMGNVPFWFFDAYGVHEEVNSLYHNIGADIRYKNIIAKRRENNEAIVTELKQRVPNLFTGELPSRL